jgi:hypothetical protein
MCHFDGCELLLRNPNFGHPKGVQNRWARAFEETVTSHCCVWLILAPLFRELAEDGTYVPRNIEKILNLCVLYPSHMVTTLIHRHHTLSQFTNIFIYSHEARTLRGPGSPHWYDMIWYDMIWYDMIWYDMIWYNMIWYNMIWYEIIYDMIYDTIKYDKIWYDMIYLTAIG